MTDIHALSGAYAVDALDEVERARFERHLTTCTDCQAEVETLTAAATELAAMTELVPPTSLRTAVLGSITTTRPLPPEQPVTDPTVPPMRAAPPDRRQHAPGWHRWRGWLVAAAAATVLAVGGVTVWRSLDQPATPPPVAEKVLAAPDATRVAETLQDGASVSIVRSPSIGKAVIVTSGMPAPPKGKVYQLWLQDPAGHFASAGLLPPGSDQVVVLEGDASTAAGVGVTVEPDGGSPQPTTPPIALLAFT